MLAGLPRIAGAKVERSKLVRGPRLRGLVADSSAAESARRSDRMRSSQRNASTHNPCSAFATRISSSYRLAVEPVEQTEQRADLTGQETRVELLTLGTALNNLFACSTRSVTASAGRLQVLYCLERCNWLLVSTPSASACARLLRSCAPAPCRSSGSRARSERTTRRRRRPRTNTCLPEPTR